MRSAQSRAPPPRSNRAPPAPMQSSSSAAAAAAAAASGGGGAQARNYFPHVDSRRAREAQQSQSKYDDDGSARVQSKRSRGDDGVIRMSEKEALHQIVDFLVSNIKDLNDKVTVLQEALTKVETEVAESARTYFVTVQQRGTEVENEDVTVPLLEFPRSDARSIAMTKNGTPLKVVGDKVPALVGEGSYLRVIDVHPDDGSQTEMFLSAENVHPGSYRSHP